MMDGEPGRQGLRLRLRILLPLGVLTLAGFLFDQYVHGRF